jgi:periplasmic copper chaperone A
MFRIAAAALALTGLFALAPAVAQQSTRLGDLTLTNLWTTATPPGAPTATGYLTVTNAGSAPDRLIAVSSPVAETAMLHQMVFSNGIASMHEIGGIDIPPGKTVTLDPSGYHLMFITLSRQLKAGETLPVTLTFAKAGKVDAVLAVLPIGSKGPATP